GRVRLEREAADEVPDPRLDRLRRVAVERRGAALGEGHRGGAHDGEGQGNRESSHEESPERAHVDGPIAGWLDADRVPERPPEAVEADAHHVAVLECNALAEAEGVRAEEMDVDVAGPAMRVELEVMVLDVAQAVAHLRLAAGHHTRPDPLAAPLDPDLARDGIEDRRQRQLRPDRRRAALRRGQIQVVLP